MTISNWVESAIRDAEQRGLPMRALLEALGRSASALREADWNDDASGSPRRKGSDGR
jgi:hypothetical protein